MEKQGLSRRQREILALVASGLGDKEIARRLGLSPYTVRNHLRRLYHEQGLHSRVQAALAWNASSPDAASAPELTSAAYLPSFLEPVRRRWPRAMVLAGLLSLLVFAWASVTRAAPLVPEGQAASGGGSAQAAAPTVSTSVQDARPAPATAKRQLTLVNYDRAAAGLAPLAWNACLAAAAAALAQRLSEQGYLAGVGGLTDPQCGYEETALNTGYWATVDDSKLNAIFVANPIQRQNLLGHYSDMGAAWAARPGGVAYLVQEFG